MASGEIPTPTSEPPPYSAIENRDAEKGGQAPYPPYPTGTGGYPTPQMNAPYPGGYPPPPGPGGYPQAGYPPSAGYPPQGGYAHAPPGTGYYPPPVSHQPSSIQTTTTTVIVRAGDQCVRCTTGRVEEHFTLGGICCAIWCFPCGIICCLSSRIRSCNRCGAIYL